MSGSTTGQVLSATASIGGGLSVLPMTGGSPLYLILPLVAISCGVVILVSLATTSWLEKRNKLG